MNERTITNDSTQSVSQRQKYETIITDDYIEIIAYKYRSGDTNVVQPQQGNKAPEDITLDAFFSRSLNEMADGLMVIRPQYTIKEQVQILDDKVIIKITR